MLTASTVPSREGTVADFFAGSGMTGLAAQQLNRRARLSDISVLGHHIARGYLTDLPEETLRGAATQAIQRARAATAPLYETRRDTDSNLVELIRTVWSFCYRCPRCDVEITYFEELNEDGKSPRSCPGCGAGFSRRSWRRSDDVPVQVVVRGENGRQVEQPVSALDWFLSGNPCFRRGSRRGAPVGGVKRRVEIGNRTQWSTIFARLRRLFRNLWAQSLGYADTQDAPVP